MLLLDSGGQYRDGTTDVTRCLFFGPTVPQPVAEAYTRVLRGHIALDTAVFPVGTPGMALDCLARQPLWEVRALLLVALITMSLDLILPLTTPAARSRSAGITPTGQATGSAQPSTSMRGPKASRGGGGTPSP